MFIYYFEVLCIHFVDLVTRCVLTFVGEILYYRNNG